MIGTVLALGSAAVIVFAAFAARLADQGDTQLAHPDTEADWLGVWPTDLTDEEVDLLFNDIREAFYEETP